MACITPDGTVTVQARKVLNAFLGRATPEDAAAATELPVYRIRSSLRELLAAGLIVAEGDGYRTTEAGRERIAA
jgi:hypothetical protein